VIGAEFTVGTGAEWWVEMRTGVPGLPVIRAE